MVCWWSLDGAVEADCAVLHPVQSPALCLALYQAHHEHVFRLVLEPPSPVCAHTSFDATVIPCTDHMSRTMEWERVAVLNTLIITVFVAVTPYTLVGATVFVAVTPYTLVGAKDIDRRFLKNVALICNAAHCQ